MLLSVVPTLFTGVVSHPHPALSVLLLSPIIVLCLCSPTLSPSGTPWVHVEGGGGLLADWIAALLVDKLDAGLLGSHNPDVPHAACPSEPPMGSTVADAVRVGPALRAGNDGAPCHLWPFTTVTTQR